MSKTKDAIFLMIGDELLSGRTQDKNLTVLGKFLADKGVVLKEARVIIDDKQIIADNVNELRAKCDYLFTSGGIGPTHDDITTESIAYAFGVAATEHPDARAALDKHYQGDILNDARLKMAIVPEGASLVANHISAAPGYHIGNVFVLAGVPTIFAAMLDEVSGDLESGEPILSDSISLMMREGDIADFVTNIQASNPEVAIGSYPFIQNGKQGTNLVVRSRNKTAIAKVIGKLQSGLIAYD